MKRSVDLKEDAPLRRKERSPYTSIACDECQRRKVKCTGGHPCKGCENAQKSCLYERTTRFRASRHGTKRKMTNEATASPPEAKSNVRIAEPRSGGSTPQSTPKSSDLYLSLAQRQWHSQNSNGQSAKPSPLLRLSGNQAWKGIKARLGQVGTEDVTPLLSAELWTDVIDLYEEEVGLQYPFIDLDELRRRVPVVSTQPSPPPDPAAADSDQWHRWQDIAKLIIACVSSLTDPDVVEPVSVVVQEMASAAMGRTTFGAINRQDLTIAILASTYFFFSDQEILAWRGIGSVLRLLHQSVCHNLDMSTLSKPSDNFGEFGAKFYWSVYAMDRRWGLGTSLPFAIQDAEIPFQPTFPDNSFSSSYLESMVAYCRIVSEVRFASNETSPVSRHSSRDFLNFRVIEWQKNLPPRLLFSQSDEKFDFTAGPRAELKLRLLLRLRSNQMRTIIYRKFAIPPDGQVIDPTCINPMVDIARDTISILLKIVDIPDVYWGQRKAFNFYLELALSSLLLVMCFSKNNQGPLFLQDVKTGFDLVEKLSTTSGISRRLWENLRVFRSPVNMAATNPQASDPSSTVSVGEGLPTSVAPGPGKFEPVTTDSVGSHLVSPPANHHQETDRNALGEQPFVSQGPSISSAAVSQGPLMMHTALDKPFLQPPVAVEHSEVPQFPGDMFPNNFWTPDMEQLLFDYENLYSF